MLARKGSIVGVVGCTSFVTFGGERGDGGEGVVEDEEGRDVPFSPLGVVKDEVERDVPLSPLGVVEKKEVVVVEERDVPIFPVGVVKEEYEMVVEEEQNVQKNFL